MEIQEALHNYIINEGLKGQVPKGFDEDYDLIESGIINSLFMMSLITYLEQQHQIEFGINDMVPKHFKTVNTLSAFVQNKLAAIN
jgi:acyl carrier protein